MNIKLPIAEQQLQILTTEQLSRKFSEILKEWLTPSQQGEILWRNRSERNKAICHTHDFVDANQAMRVLVACECSGMVRDAFSITARS